MATARWSGTYRYGGAARQRLVDAEILLDEAWNEGEDGTYGASSFVTFYDR